MTQQNECLRAKERARRVGAQCHERSRRQARQRTPPAAEDAQGPSGRPAGARRGARAARRPRAPARPLDRAPAPDPGPLRPSRGRAPCGAGAGDEACAHRGLRGRDLLRPFRRGEGRRQGAAAGYRARVRQPQLRHGRGRAVARRAAGQARPERPRRARAVHGRLRPCAGVRGRARPGDGSDGGERGGLGTDEAARAALPAARGFRGVPGRRRLCAARRLSRRPAQPRGHHQGGERCQPARPRRRRLSHWAQVDAGARRAGAAPGGRQCRRGRARHLQGPLLPRR